MPTPDIDEDMAMLFFPANMETKNCTTGALVQMHGVKAGNNSTIVYFKSADCQVEASRIENAGGQIFKPKMSIGDYGFIVLGIDTEGNMFGIHSMK